MAILVSCSAFFDFGRKFSRLFDCTVVGQLEEDFGVEHVQGPPDRRLEVGRTDQEREQLNYHPPNNDSSHTLALVPSPALSRPPRTGIEEDVETEADEVLVRELEALVGHDDDDDDVETIGRVESIRTMDPDNRHHRSEKDEDADYYEITEHVTETQVETQTIEHYNVGPADEWSEVEAMTQLADAGEDDEGYLAMLNNDRAVIPTVASAAYADALEHPHANSMRVQVIVSRSHPLSLSRSCSLM